MRARDAALAALSALALEGCASMSTRLTADPLAPGDWQAGVAVDGVLFRDIEQQGTVPGGRVELTARRGVTEDLDVGVKLYESGIDASARVRLSKGSWSLAVAPAAGLGATAETAVFPRGQLLHAHLPFIASTRLSDRTAIALGPKALYSYLRLATGGDFHGASLGAFFFFDWRFSDRWHLTPEVNLYRSIAGEVPVKGWSAQVGPGLAVDF